VSIKIGSAASDESQGLVQGRQQAQIGFRQDIGIVNRVAIQCRACLGWPLWHLGRVDACDRHGDFHPFHTRLDYRLSRFDVLARTCAQDERSEG
jgi:hypothetical protein